MNFAYDDPCGILYNRLEKAEKDCKSAILESCNNPESDELGALAEEALRHKLQCQADFDEKHRDLYIRF